jgi:hypothetical protein
VTARFRLGKLSRLQRFEARVVLERPAAAHAERVEFERARRVLGSFVHAELLEQRA